MQRTWLIALAVLLGSCGADVSSPAPVTASSVATTSSSTGPATTVSAITTTTRITPDLAVFIAALDEALTDTAYAGTAIDDPEVYIATGQLFCERLAGGSEPETVLADYLDALTQGDIGRATPDQVSLAGILLGVSVEVLCPEQITALP